MFILNKCSIKLTNVQSVYKTVCSLGKYEAHAMCASFWWVP